MSPPAAPAPMAPPPAAPAAAARAAIASDPSKKFKVVPVFYGTDRAIELDPARLRFGSDRGHKLQLGRALITVPFSHEVPHIERPRIFEIPYFKYKIYEETEDPNKHFTLQEIASLSEDQMLALVKEHLAKSSTFKDHAFVFVHGFNTSFDCALYRTAQIAYDLGFDGVPFLYSWPSGGRVASYTYDYGSAEQAEPMLAEFLKLVIERSGAKSISLIAHSMGNQVLLRVLERMRPKIPEGVVISQVILAAPDVDRDKFNIIAREISNFAKGVTLYAASNDRALGYSARFWGGVPRAGDVPQDGPLIIPGVDTIDVTAVSTDALGLNHSGYAENPALLNDVKALVQLGIRPPDKRLKSILAVESPTGTFWRFQATN
ncbi:alpha/beta hydrolase [Hyphomicrobium sp.]|uniref:alpha/beta hydrolase n=1 Tax=Hyphomicrobium sp. TaxID=82 RepID=UPI002D76C705|nr:alpha/beta fold hydrolase [Hyphomicrobium sp.]HET6389265.1 alpha/beta fold hydrolase [Hyphomicrobium sp.]